ncbi:MAG: redox-sensing transcriptional repressor Rex [bacterium]|nr:redox-sensing transcriptional repressor Rex [bacterium]
MKAGKNEIDAKISDSTIRRLSTYHRTLNILERTGIETISSKKLAEIENITSAQIRKDLSYFGSFGRRGLGYNVSLLKNKIAKILGLDRKWEIILIGSGHLGKALMNYDEFEKKNFYITKIFDKDPAKIGRKIGKIKVEHIDGLEKNVDPGRESLAILAIPPDDVQSIVNRLSKLGIKGVLYFASRTVSVPKNLIVRNEDTTIELETLTYHITNKTDRPIRTT